MTRQFSTYKDIPIGLIIKKDLRMRKMSQKSLARIIDMPYRSLNKSLNGQRSFKREEADKIDSFFKYELSFVFRVQEYRKYQQHGQSPKLSIGVPVIRKCVFWDINMESLDWIKHRNFIINRINSYGNQEEIRKVRDFYKSYSTTE